MITPNFVLCELFFIGREKMSGYKIDQYGNAVEDKRCPGDSPRAFWFRDIMRKKEAGQGAETDQETERYFMDNHILDGRLGTLTAEIKVLFCLKEPNCSRENEKKTRQEITGRGRFIIISCAY